MRDRLDSASAFREHSVIVFVNSAAGGGRASVCLPRIQKVFKSLRMQAQFVMTNSASELESCAQAAISHGEQLLFAMGGDGTFQSLVNASFGADVVLGILPIGGGNDFASALGLPSEPLEAKVLLAAVLNSPTYGAGVRLAPGAAVDDGLLHVVLIEEFSKFGVLTLLPRLMGSGDLRTSRVKRWRAQRVKLTTNRLCLFHGDGEILGPTPVEIEIVPKAVRVLASAPAVR